MTTTPAGIDSWTDLLGSREIPVLRQTARALTDSRSRAESINVREVADIVLRDPLMTVRVLRYCMRNRSRRQLQDIDTVEHAVMMLGVEPFFRHFAQFDIVEDQLKAEPQALLGLLNVIKRAQRAARFAVDWATWRCDLNSEELAVAALLYDLAELMTWCFAPKQALAVRKLQQENPGIRSAVAQTAVLGFSLHELQIKLCHAWCLPEILLNLMDGNQQDKPRVKNVRLAVDLARHTANGWDDPALPDDFKAIAALMNIDEATLMLRLGLKKPDDAQQDGAGKPA